MIARIRAYLLAWWHRNVIADDALSRRLDELDQHARKRARRGF